MNNKTKMKKKKETLTSHSFVALSHTFGFSEKISQFFGCKNEFNLRLFVYKNPMNSGQT
jgi:hypothetical protein